MFRAGQWVIPYIFAGGGDGGDATAGDDSETSAFPKSVTCTLHFSIGGGGKATFLTDLPPAKVSTSVDISGCKSFLIHVAVSG